MLSKVPEVKNITHLKRLDHLLVFIVLQQTNEHKNNRSHDPNPYSIRIRVITNYYEVSYHTKHVDDVW